MPKSIIFQFHLEKGKLRDGLFEIGGWDVPANICVAIRECESRLRGWYLMILSERLVTLMAWRMYFSLPPLVMLKRAFLELMVN